MPTGCRAQSALDSGRSGTRPFSVGRTGTLRTSLPIMKQGLLLTPCLLSGNTFGRPGQPISSPSAAERKPVPFFSRSASFRRYSDDGHRPSMAIYHSRQFVGSRCRACDFGGFFHSLLVCRRQRLRIRIRIFSSSCGTCSRFLFFSSLLVDSLLNKHDVTFPKMRPTGYSDSTSSALWH